MDEATKNYIFENAEKDVHQLGLQSSKYPLVNMPLAIRQITGRQKIRLKVPLFYNTAEILYPAQLSLEQSSSETTARYKSMLCNGNSLVDLTGGFGVDCAFMSTNFKQVTYVERQEELCELAKNNFNFLYKKHIEIVNAQSETYLNIINNVDWIYLDPARRSASGKKVVFLSDCEPDVSLLSGILLQKSKNVMVKLSPMMDVTAAVRELSQTSEIHIIAVENECKEVLILLNQSSENRLKITTVNFGKNEQNQYFTFNADEETNCQIQYASTLGKYLYEPNAAIMKSGAFKMVSSHFKLYKLHINTHLYTSNDRIFEFPGRIFEIAEIWENGKNEWKNEAKKLKKTNLSIRNFPSSVDELRKKLKLADGGDTYLFACTLANDQKVMLLCKKIRVE